MCSCGYQWLWIETLAPEGDGHADVVRNRRMAGANDFPWGAELGSQMADDDRLVHQDRVGDHGLEDLLATASQEGLTSVTGELPMMFAGSPNDRTWDAKSALKAPQLQRQRNMQ